MKLSYFRNQNVPIVRTIGVDKEVPLSVVRWLMVLAFGRAEELKEKGMEASYFQVFNVKSERTSNENIKYSVEMTQEQPDYTSNYDIELNENKEFNGTVWIIESWNGETENVTINDHYITVLLPCEY